MNTQCIATSNNVVTGHLNGSLSRSKITMNKDLFLNKFLDRLNLRTIPHIRPLLDRLKEAEHKNLDALKSIDKINRKIKEIEIYVANTSKLPSNLANSKSSGTDLTDTSSAEHAKFINSVQTSTFAPFKPINSQNHSKTAFNTFERHVVAMKNLQNNGANGKMNGKSEMPIFTLQQFQALFQEKSQDSRILPAIENVLIQYLPEGAILKTYSIPILTWRKSSEGILLEWNMNWQDNKFQPTGYHIYSFQKSECVSDFIPWKLIGKTVALPLPMSCTLNIFSKSDTYYFVMRATLNDTYFSVWSNFILVETP